MDWIKRIALVSVAVAAVIVGFLIPQPEPALPPALPAAVDSPYVVCPVALAGGGFEGQVGVVTDSDLSGRYGAIGEEESPIDFAVVAGDSVAFSVGELGEVGINPVLVERGVDSLGQLAAGTYDRAGTVAALAGCQSASVSPVALLGLATNAGEGSTIVISNPFAAEATVRLIGSSEFGADTPSDFESVRIPAHSTTEIILDQTMAGREQLGFTVQPEQGLVVAGMTRTGPDTAVSEAIPGSQQWYVSLPGFGVPGTLIVHSLAPGPNEFRIDRVDPNGITEGVASGELDPNTGLVFSLEDLGEGEGGFIVNSTDDVAVATSYAGPELRTVSAGVPTLALQWLVPVSAVSADGDATLWIFNPGETDTTASIDVLGREGAPVEIDLAAGTTTGLVLDLDGGGANVTTGEPVAIFYGVLTGTRAGMTPAFPLE